MIPSNVTLKIVAEHSGKYTGDVVYEDERGGLWVPADHRDEQTTGVEIAYKIGNTIQK